MGVAATAAVLLRAENRPQRVCARGPRSPAGALQGTACTWCARQRSKGVVRGPVARRRGRPHHPRSPPPRTPSTLTSRVARAKPKRQYVAKAGEGPRTMSGDVAVTGPSFTVTLPNWEGWGHGRVQQAEGAPVTGRRLRGDNSERARSQYSGRTAAGAVGGYRWAAVSLCALRRR